MNSWRVSDLPAKLPTTCPSAQLPSHQAVLSHHDKENMNCERKNMDFPGLGCAEIACVPNPKAVNVLLHGIRDSVGLTELAIL